jgi:hypothetical protein
MNAVFIVEAELPEVAIQPADLAPLELRTLDDAELLHVGGGNCVADY